MPSLIMLARIIQSGRFFGEAMGNLGKQSII